MVAADDAGGSWERIKAEAQGERQRREKSYRDKALRVLPHVCARCGREFSGKRLSELTVHHKDHNPKNNPPDGRNWELLCVYCHDDEHSRLHQAQERDASDGDAPTGGTFKAFAGLAEMLKDKK